MADGRYHHVEFDAENACCKVERIHCARGWDVSDHDRHENRGPVHRSCLSKRLIDTPVTEAATIAA